MSGLCFHSRQAVKYHEKELELSLQEKRYASPTEQIEAVVKARRFLGVCLTECGKFKQALQQHRLALEFCESASLEEERQYALCNLGVTLLERADHISDDEKRKRTLNEAIYYFRESINAAKKISDDVKAVPPSRAGTKARKPTPEDRAVLLKRRAWLKANMIVDAYNNIGLTYDALGEHKQSIESLHEALELHSNTFGRNDTDIARHPGMNQSERRECLERRSKLYSAIGLNIMHMGDLKTAEGYLKADLSISTSLRFNNDYGKAHLNLGDVYMCQRRFKEALEEYNRALAVAAKFHDSAVGDVQELATWKTANAKRARTLEENASTALAQCNSLVKTDITTAFQRLSRTEMSAGLKRLRTAFSAYVELHELTNAASDLEQASLFGDRVIRVARGLEEAELAVRTSFELGVLLTELKPQEAKPLLEEACTSFREKFKEDVGVGEDFAKVCACLLQIARKERRFDEALLFTHDLIDVHARLGDLAEQASAYADQGNVLDELGRSPADIAAAYEESLRLARGAKDEQLELEALENLDLCLRDVEAEKARSYRSRALALRKRIALKKGEKVIEDEDDEDESSQSTKPRPPVPIAVAPTPVSSRSSSSAVPLTFPSPAPSIPHSSYSSSSPSVASISLPSSPANSQPNNLPLTQRSPASTGGSEKASSPHVLSQSKSQTSARTSPVVVNTSTSSR